MSYEITLFSKVNTSTNNEDEDHQSSSPKTSDIHPKNNTNNTNTNIITNNNINTTNHNIIDTIPIDDPNSITIILWLNGADKDHYFPYKIDDYKQKSLRTIKDQISKFILSSPSLSKIHQNKKSLTIFSLFNLNEILINDYDIQYLNQNEILFFTISQSETFNQSNHFNIYNFNDFINSGGFAKIF